jgi:hypothetical protein
MTTLRAPLYACYRFPAELTNYAIWLYFRFPLSLRMVEEMLAARGIAVTRETIRQWGLKSGREFANRIRRRAPVTVINATCMRSSSSSPAREALALACSRPGGLRSRCPRAEPARQESCQAPVSQATEEAGASAACAEHRQVEKL